MWISGPAKWILKWERGGEPWNTCGPLVGRRRQPCNSFCFETLFFFFVSLFSFAIHKNVWEEVGGGEEHVLPPPLPPPLIVPVSPALDIEKDSVYNILLNGYFCLDNKVSLVLY